MKKRTNILKGILGACMMMAGIFLSTNVQAQDCGCDHVVEVNTTFIDGNQLGIKPGDVVCLKAGKRTNLLIKNLKGSSSAYVTIKNCGGQVVLGGSTINNGILFQNSRYFRLTGTGSSSYEYGIKIDKTKAGSQGVAVTEFSSDVEIDHIEVNGAGFAGIMAKTDPKCDGSADRGKFTMYNVKIHDNYLHDIGGEGIYLGNSFYNGTSVYCNRTQYPHDVKGVRVYNNIVKNTGWEGIQVGSASHDVEIYDNEVHNYGMANRDSQNNGIQLGLGTTGKCYNNYIENGYGHGIVIQGIGNNLVYNNVIKGAGYPAFNVNVRPTPLSTDVVSKGFLGGIYIINNTIIDSKNKGAINEYVNAAPNNVFYNNLIVSGNTNFSQLKTYTSWKLEKNLLVKDVASAKFVNSSAGDYSLQQGSPAVEAGKDISSYGISLDWHRKTRKSGNNTDCGISEYAGTVATPTVTANVAPTVNAGSDQSIQLPLNTATFTGNASDQDGTIASYAWTKVNGPSATMNGSNTAKLQLSNLIAGTYTFRLTVKDDKGASASNEAVLTVKAATVVQEEPAPAPEPEPAPEETPQEPTGTSPEVYAGRDKTLTLPQNSTTLIFSGKTSGQWRSFRWTKQSGPSASMQGENTANCNISNLVQGTYTFRITATDSNGGSGWDELNIIVLGNGEEQPTETETLNQAPVAAAGSDRTITLPTNSISITGSGSDKDGSISSYAWTKVSGPSAGLSGTATATLKVTNMPEGTYTFRLTVKDNQGAAASDEVKVTVNPAPVVVSSEPVPAPAPAPEPAPAPAPQGPVYRINAGGNAVQGSPIQWDTDTKESPSKFLSTSSSNNVAGASSWNRTNNTSAPNAVFANMRFDFSWGGAMQYNLPVKNGTYEVRFYFAETPYSGGVTAANQRVFDIKMEGQTKVSGLDIYKEAGMNALQKTVVMNVTDGTLNIDFIRRTGNPQVNGIEIIATTTSTATMSVNKDNKLNDFTTFTEQALSVFPNPVENVVNIRFGHEIQSGAHVQLLDLEGRSLLNNDIPNATGTTEAGIDISHLNLPAGIYLLKVQTDGNKAQVVKLMKN